MDKIVKTKYLLVGRRIVYCLFSLFCYGATLYMMAILYGKYKDNLDSSQVSMKKFNQSPAGKYPSFTFCVYAPGGILLKEEVLQKKHGINMTYYYNLLQGEVNDSNGMVQRVKFENVAKGIYDFFTNLMLRVNHMKNTTRGMQNLAPILYLCF